MMKYDTKKSKIVDYMVYLYIFVFCLLLAFIIGAIGFVITHKAKIFDICLLIGILYPAFRILKATLRDDKEQIYRDKLLKVAKSAKIVNLRTPTSLSMLIDNRQVLDGPIFEVKFLRDFVQIKVLPDGCPNADNIYQLQHRLEEQFGLTAQLISKRDCAIYMLYSEPNQGRRISNADFR